MSPVPERETRVLRGVLFVVLATIFFVIMNTGAKYLSAHVPTPIIVWARTLGHLVFVIALFAPIHGGWRLLVGSGIFIAWHQAASG